MEGGYLHSIEGGDGGISLFFTSDSEKSNGQR